MRLFSSKQRREKLQQLMDKPLDVLIIGGGITGAGIALDATTRGLRTGLIEMQDFAAGTSSRSTKLVHGGLRYLKQLEVKIVHEVGRERAVVYENGPHVTTPEWMMLPFYKGGTFGPFSTNIGLRVYDLLAGVKRKERRKMFNSNQAIKREPLLNEKDLKGAGYYVEYKTDDARLTIEVLKKAVEHGANALNYVKVTNLIYDDGKVIGVHVKDQLNEKEYDIYANKIINATGPWVDELREMDGSKQGKTLHLTKGVHLVFAQEKFPLEQAIYFDTPDGRMIFAIPRENKTYVGTTDTDYNGSIVTPSLDEADVHYLITAINDMFPSVHLLASDVESSWAGLRPLIQEEGKDPSEISRKDEVFIAKSGLISIAGGKLTGYRKMAEEVIDVVVGQLKKEVGILYSKSETYHIPISGGDVGGANRFNDFIEKWIKKGVSAGFQESYVRELVEKYGSNIETLLELGTKNKQAANELGMDPLLYTELIYAMDYEQAFKPVDFFIRRTGALFFNMPWVKEHQENVIKVMAKHLSWTKEEQKAYRLELQAAIDAAEEPMHM